MVPGARGMFKKHISRGKKIGGYQDVYPFWLQNKIGVPFLGVLPQKHTPTLSAELHGDSTFQVRASSSFIALS